VEIITKKRMMLFTGTIHPALGHEIADCLSVPVSESELRRFASGEIYFRAKESVRGADVFVVQTHYDPVNEAVMEQLVMLDAMKRASAKRITAVIPYYGYSRQDKKSLGREPISARLVARALETAGAALLGRVLDQAFDGTIRPLAYGFLVYGLVALALVLLAAGGLIAPRGWANGPGAVWIPTDKGEALYHELANGSREPPPFQPVRTPANSGPRPRTPPDRR